MIKEFEEFENNTDERGPETILGPTDAEKIKMIRTAIQEILDAKNHIEGMLALGANGRSEDTKILLEKRKTIETEFNMAQMLIDRQFELLEIEIQNGGDIVSQSGRIYKPEDVISIINKLKNDANSGQLVDYNLVTRTNDLRPRVSELLNLILELKRIYLEAKQS